MGGEDGSMIDKRTKVDTTFACGFNGIYHMMQMQAVRSGRGVLAFRISLSCMSWDCNTSMKATKARKELKPGFKSQV